MDKDVIYVVVSSWNGEGGHGHDIELTTTDRDKAKDKLKEVWEGQIGDEYNGIDFSDETAGWEKTEDESCCHYWNMYDDTEFTVAIEEHKLVH